MKHSDKLLIITWPMFKQTMTWLTRQSWNAHILTNMRNTWSGNTLKRTISMKTMERASPGWCRARDGVHGRTRCGWTVQPSEDGKGVVNTVVLPKDATCGATVPRMNRSQCTCGYTRTSGCEDSVDTLSDLLALCRNGRFQCGVRAHTHDRRSVCGTSRGGKLAKGQGLAIAKNTKWIALRGGSLPRISAELTRRCRVQAGHLGSVHLQRSCEGEGDVVGVVAPFGGVAQVIFHGVQVVEVGVQVRVHEEGEKEKDGEVQVEVERDVEEDQGQRHMCNMA